MTDNNVVYVGNKPVMNYVLAVVKEFNSFRCNNDY
ncbi:hypothetical protein ig2599ANME_1753 [groundwater metagenome]